MYIIRWYVRRVDEKCACVEEWVGGFVGVFIFIFIFLINEIEQELKQRTN
jgi:uncharacterized membrane protein